MEIAAWLKVLLDKMMNNLFGCIIISIICLFFGPIGWLFIIFVWINFFFLRENNNFPE